MLKRNVENIPSFFNETSMYVNFILDFFGLQDAKELRDTEKYCVNALQKSKSDIFEKAAGAYLASKSDESLTVNENDSELSSLKKLTLETSSRLSFSRLKIVFKVLVNWGFYFSSYFYKDIKADVVVRSWVEVSTDIYGRKPEYLYLVYPFGLNIKRQVSFIRQLRAHKLNYRLCGYNYSLKKLFHWLVSGKDVHLAELELDAFYRQADFILSRFSPKTVLTTDEFEPASFALNNKMMNAGVTVINTAHGVGKYSPFISYSQFNLLNNAQAEYYTRFSGSINIKFIQEDPQPKLRAAPLTIVFVDQLLKNDGSALEISQRAVFDKLSSSSKLLGFDFVIKPHPNSVAKHLGFENCIYKGDIKDLLNPVFYTFFSTAFLTFRKYGPTFLIRDHVFDPALVFGESDRVVDVDNLDKHLSGLQKDLSFD